MSINAKPLETAVAEYLDVDFRIRDLQIYADELELEGLVTFTIEDDAGVESHWTVDVSEYNFDNHAALMDILTEFAANQVEDATAGFTVEVV